MMPADPPGPDGVGPGGAWPIAGGSDGTGEPSLVRTPLSSLPPQYQASDEISLDDPTPEEVAPGVGDAHAGRRVTGPDPSLAPPPATQRVVRPAAMFPLWFAASSSPITVVVGGVLYGFGMSIGQTVLAVVIGVAASAIPVAAGVIASRRSGRPTMVVSRGLLGERPRFRMLPSAIAVVPRVVATGVLLFLLSSAVGDLSGNGGSAAVVGGAAVVIVAAAAVALSVPGFRVLAAVQKVIAIVMGALVLAFIAVTAGRIDFRVALTIGDGPIALVVGGAVMVFSITGLLWATGAGDLSRHLRTGSSGVAAAGWVTLGMLGPALVFVPYGALLASSDGAAAEEFMGRPLGALIANVPAWFAIPLSVAVLVGLASSIVVSVYTAGLAVEAAVPRVPRVTGAAAVAATSAVLALVFGAVGADAAGLLREGSTTIGVPIAAWAGVFTARTITSRFGRARGAASGRHLRDLLLIVIAIVVGWGLTAGTTPLAAWQGYLWAAVGAPADGAIAMADVGVFVAFAIGLAAFATGGRAVPGPSRATHRTDPRVDDAR